MRDRSKEGKKTEEGREKQREGKKIGESAVGGRWVKIWFSLSASLVQPEMLRRSVTISPPQHTHTHIRSLHSFHLSLSFKPPLTSFLLSSPLLLSFAGISLSCAATCHFDKTDLLVTSYFFPVLIKCCGGGPDSCSD